MLGAGVGRDFDRTKALAPGRGPVGQTRSRASCLLACPGPLGATLLLPLGSDVRLCSRTARSATVARATFSLPYQSVVFARSARKNQEEPFVSPAGLERQNMS